MEKLAMIPTLQRIVKNAFKEVYQHFIYSALTSTVLAICNIPIFMIIFATSNFMAGNVSNSVAVGEMFSMLIWGLILCAIWNTIVAAPVSTAMYSLYQNKKEAYPGFKTFFSLLFKHYRAAFTVNGLFSFFFALLVMNVVIAMMERTLLFFIIGMFSFYLLIFIILMSFFFAPLIHLNNGIKKTIKKAFLLVMDNTVMSVCLILLLGILFVLSIIIPVFWFIVFGAFLVYITDLGFYAIYDRYEE